MTTPACGDSVTPTHITQPIATSETTRSTFVTATVRCKPPMLTAVIAITAKAAARRCCSGHRYVPSVSAIAEHDAVLPTTKPHRRHAPRRARVVDDRRRTCLRTPGRSPPTAPRMSRCRRRRSRRWRVRPTATRLRREPRAPTPRRHRHQSSSRRRSQRHRPRQGVAAGSLDWSRVATVAARDDGEPGPVRDVGESRAEPAGGHHRPGTVAR